MLFLLGSFILGFALGYFCTPLVLAVVTGIALMVCILMWKRGDTKERALDGLFGSAVLAIGVIAMWMTHLFVTIEPIGFDISPYIFRQ